MRWWSEWRLGRLALPLALPVRMLLWRAPALRR
jgi:hypothetical protein